MDMKVLAECGIMISLYQGSHTFESKRLDRLGGQFYDNLQFNSIE